MPGSDVLVIRSYRSVFRFERRLYRIDRWRLPVRGGVPVRGLLYLPLVYALLALAARVPLLGSLLATLPAPLHWGLLPFGLAFAALRARLDGRPSHRAAWALMRFALERRWLAGLRPCPPPAGAIALAGVMIVRPDGHGTAYREGRVRGPARVLLRRPAELTSGRSRRRLVLVPAGGPPLAGGRVLELPARTELVIR